MQPIVFVTLLRWHRVVLALTAACICLALSAVCFPAQAQMFTTLHVFYQHSSNGASPYTALLQGNDGNFYGTASAGGANDAGAVFQMDAAGNVTVLHSFNNTDGANPQAALIQGSDGFFYGTTLQGGDYGRGTVFKLDAAGNFTPLHSFRGFPFDGANPQAALIQGSDGSFYGTTYFGGENDVGSVFKMDAAGNVSVLYSFSGTDGVYPYSSLIQGSDGFFYGTTSEGGEYDAGAVFKMDTDGNITVLYSFGASSKDGYYPYASLLQGRDGNFYGTTYYGGAHSKGAVFQMDAAGNVALLHSFSNTDGSGPLAALLQASDGKFYGTTAGGGTNNLGAVFKMDTAGNVNLLYSFGGSASDGENPNGLIQGNNGLLYGTTNAGGDVSSNNPAGTVFQFDLALPASVPVSGKITLQSCVSSAVSSQSLTFTLRPTNGTASFSQNAILASDGSFSLSSIPLGTYTLHIKGRKWLPKNVSVTTTAGSVSGITATLLAGDVNGDNQVSLADYALLRNAFGSKPGSANWNANADLNCDGQVSLADYVLLRNNFGKRGDP